MLDATTIVRIAVAKQCRYPLLGNVCAPSECDPLNPRIPTESVGDVTYFNYGIRADDIKQVSTTFSYSFVYTNWVDTNVGAGVGGGGPFDAHTGVTLVEFSMHNVTSGAPVAMKTSWTQAGCNRGTRDSPVLQSSSTCTYSSIRSWRFYHLSR